MIRFRLVFLCFIAAMAMMAAGCSSDDTYSLQDDQGEGGKTMGMDVTNNTLHDSQNDNQRKLPEPDRVKIYLAGDSTVSDYDADQAPRAGWGQVLGTFFDKRVTIFNHAASGRSSKSFIEEGRLAAILNQIEEGDHLFIQFGHNDEKKDNPSIYTEPSTTFKGHLRQYIDGAREKGAIPVLITPVERRRFTLGEASDSHGLYPKAVRELGEELDVPVIDLTAKSKVLFNELGEEGTKHIFLFLAPGESSNYPEGIEDNTHFQEQGALELAKLVTEGIKELKLPLGEWIIEKKP